MISNLFKDYNNQYSDMDAKELAQKILAETNIDMEPNKIERMILLERIETNTYGGTGRKGDSFVIGDEQYEFNFKGYLWDMDKEQIEYAIRRYVGGDTYSDVCDSLYIKYERVIDEKFLERVFRCLGVTRTSPPIAPHQYLEMSQQEYTNYALMLKKTALEERALQEEELYKKALEEEITNRVTLDRVVQDIKKYIDEKGISDEVTQVLPPTNGSDETAVIVLSDWHVGLEYDCYGRQYNKDIFEKRLRYLIGQIKCQLMLMPNVGRALVVCAGDMVDGPMGTMRPEQALEQDLHHEDQCLVVGEGIARVNRMLVQSGLAVKNICVGGNHGRVTSDRDDDPGRMADQVSYLMAAAASPSSVEFERTRQEVAIEDIGRTRLIIAHGDKVSTNKANDLALAYRANHIDYYVVVSGHYHAIYAEETHRGVYAYRGGSMCGQDDYSARIGKGCLASQMMFEVRHIGPMFPIMLRLE